MAEQTFRSPGFFEREIDLTQRTREIEGVPAGVIGMAQKGPAFVPVTVGSFVDFERRFGTLDTELFGPYAVNEWLEHRTALTYIRVLGAGANADSTDIAATVAKGTVKNAGFRVLGKGEESDTPAALAGGGRLRGGVQFISAVHNVITEYESVGYPIFSDNDSFDTSTDLRLVRGMVMMASGARMEVLHHNSYYSGVQTTTDLAQISSYDGTSGEGTFKLIISASGTGFSNDEGFPGIRIYTASLDPSSKHYIGKILNTSTDRFHAEQHILYADFAVESELARVKYDASNPSVGILSGSTETSNSSGDTSLRFCDVYGSFNTRYQAARTTSFISQPYGADEYDLFHFEMIDDGTAGNAKVKVSISNLKRSTNPKSKYGSFTVLIRDFTDTDTNMKILEQYPLCTLNPADDDYIANRIGDLKVSYNFDAETDSEKRLMVSGKRPNKSAYVRVKMTAAAENDDIPADALPFGFRGLPVPKTTDNLRDDTSTLSVGSNRGRLTRVAGGIAETGTETLTHAVVPPVPLRFKATRNAILQTDTPGFTGAPGALELADNRYFFGVKFERCPVTASLDNAVLTSNASSAKNPLVSAYSKFLGIAKLDALTTGSGADAFCNNKFTLAKVAFYNSTTAATTTIDSEVDVVFTGSVDEHMREAAYLRNGRLVTPQYTIQDGATNPRRITFASLAAARSATKFNRFTDYMKFTNMFYGGFDGLNILDRDQRLMNDKASSVGTGGKAVGDELGYTNLSTGSSPGSGKENNIISSYRTAAKIITDPMATRVNVISVPGIRDSYVTDFLSDLTRTYSKAIYIMDMPAYDDDTNRLYDDATVRPNVRRSVEQFESRALDNNYVATYFPDVIIEDPINRASVNVPASIAAVGALAYNDAVAYPWFAPAGFNRGALDNVMNTEVRLTAEDRNVMYESMINPIANFPDGGFVIFGQKTLQQARSALDRVNVRRMLLEVKRIVSDIAVKIIFEQNTPATRARFVAQVTPQLATIQAQQGIDQFKVVMDSSNNTDEDIEQNRLNGRIVLVPTRAVEFIAIDFIITNSGVSFE